jgi:hypothetical protein
MPEVLAQTLPAVVHYLARLLIHHDFVVLVAGTVNDTALDHPPTVRA